jgi:geranylgeranyl pyrophosphate synthase
VWFVVIKIMNHTQIEEMLLEFQGWLEGVLTETIGAIVELNPAQKRMKQAIEYSVLGGGKRIRAFMIAQSCKHYGINRDEIKPLLAAIEMVHAYSLIHDDLPAMDNSPERRGKPSVHIAFNEATALLTGNALFGLAFDEILHNLQVKSEVRLEVIKHLSLATGYYGMMSGQMFDIMITKMSDVSVDEITQMNQMKTGDLFAFCMACGGILAEKPQDVDMLKKIGYDFGYIFQVIDDILDFAEDTDGKTEVEIRRNFINQLGGVDAAKKHLISIINQLQEVLSGMPVMANLVDYIFKRVC